jgi:uncharacterized membrane protein YhhN
MGLALALPVATWLIALLAPQPASLYQKGAIVLGLLLAILAFAFRLSNLLPVYAAHAHLMLTYALYAGAFAARTTGWPTLWALLVLVAAAGVLWWLWRSLAELRESILLYALLLLLALWQALEMAVQQPAEIAAWAALVGMAIICLAALLEAQARFRPIRSGWGAAALPLLLIGHFAVAWSVWA